MKNIQSPLDRYAPKPPPLPLPGHPLVTEVMAGRRFVTYPFVVSLLLISFKRNMGGMRVVENGQWPIAPVFGASLVTILFGWWGFPWGIVWSPLALYYLWMGGRDSTKEILAAEIGAAEAMRVLKTAPKVRPPSSIWLVRALILIPVVLFCSLVYSIATAGNT
jgi:hypothetical protein